MTDPLLPAPLPPAPDPAPPPPPEKPESPPADSAPARPSRSVVPVLGALGFVLVALALVFLWDQIRNQAVPPFADPARVTTLESQMRGVQQQLTQLGQRLDQLEQRPAGSAAVDLGPLESRLAALEQRPQVAPAPAPPPAPDNRIDAMLQRLSQDEAQARALADRAARLGRLQQARMALEAGQKLGDIQGAPPALARFAATPPPTEAALRLGFPEAAAHAEAASRPDATGSVADRIWQHVESLVTVREGQKVIIGPPAALVLGEARQKLDAGDLQGCLGSLDRLDPAAAAAMAPWRAQAQALLDARAALATLAAG